MKTIKKLLALTLVLCMVFCLSSAVFAVSKDEDDNFVDESTITITKIYNLTNPGQGISPADTFYLTQDGNAVISQSDATSAPDLPTITVNGETTKYVGQATFAAGAAGNTTNDAYKTTFTVNLPEATLFTNVGEYKYKLKEVQGTTAGVTYYDKEFYLVITVINDSATGKLRIAQVHTEDPFSYTTSEKKDSITNTYSAGSLSIKKNVTGNLGDKNKYFKFTVTLTAADGKTGTPDSFTVPEAKRGSYTENGGNPSSIPLGTATTFYLKHDETFEIDNIPYGVSYTVTEEQATDYEAPSYDNKQNGTINAASTETVVTNNRGGTIDMGVTLDSLPYILALAVVFGGAVVMFTRKRHVED